MVSSHLTCLCLAHHLTSISLPQSYVLQIEGRLTGAVVSRTESGMMACISKKDCRVAFVVMVLQELLAEPLSSSTHIDPHALWEGFDCCGPWHFQ